MLSSCAATHTQPKDKKPFRFPVYTHQGARARGGRRQDAERRPPSTRRANAHPQKTVNEFFKNSNGRRRPTPREKQKSGEKGGGRLFTLFSLSPEREKARERKTNHPPPLLRLCGAGARRYFFRTRGGARARARRLPSHSARKSRAPPRAQLEKTGRRARGRGTLRCLACCCCWGGFAPLSRATPPGAWRWCSRSWGRPRT